MKIRKPVSTLSFVAACATLLASPHALAKSDQLQKYSTLCEQNVTCSRHAMGVDILFKMRLPSRTSNILCKDNGKCELLLPRGRSQQIDNIEARLSAK